jgi:glycosyltransferase involved in cell wall biosynthesis
MLRQAGQAAPPVLPSTLILVENHSVPADSRVWSICVSLRRAGWDVTVVSPKGEKWDTAPFERLESVEIHRFDAAANSGDGAGYVREYTLAFVRMSTLVHRLSSRRSFDVVHACNPPDFLLLMALRMRRRGVAMIFDHHDLSPELHAAKFVNGSVAQIALRQMERLAFVLADTSLAMNESFRDVAITRGRMAPADVFVVRNGPDLEIFRPVAPDPGLSLGASHLIGFVGLMNSQDGVGLALAALSALARRRSDWHAIFVGDGDVLGGARESVVRLGLDDRVTFTGFVPDNGRLAGFVPDKRRLVQIISSCDVCISPEPRNQLNEQSTFVKIAEYMAVGRPIVAFDLRETRRTAGDAAVYAVRDDADAFAEAIDGLLDRPAHRARMGAVGRERMLEGLSWSCSEEALMAAYAHAVSKAAHRPRRR